MTIGPHPLPRAIPEIRGAFTGFRVFMREEMTESLLVGIETGRLAFALIALPFETGPLATILLFLDITLPHPGITPLDEAKRDLDLLLIGMRRPRTIDFCGFTALTERRVSF